MAGLRRTLPPAPAFREGVNVLFSGTEKIQKVQVSFVNDQLAPAQFQEYVLVEQAKEHLLVLCEEFHALLKPDR